MGAAVTERGIRAALAARPPNCDCADAGCSQVCPRRSACPGWEVVELDSGPVAEWCESCWPAAIEAWHGTTFGNTDPDTVLPEARLALAEARAEFAPSVMVSVALTPEEHARLSNATSDVAAYLRACALATLDEDEARMRRWRDIEAGTTKRKARVAGKKTIP